MSMRIRATPRNVVATAALLALLGQVVLRQLGMRHSQQANAARQGSAGVPVSASAEKALAALAYPVLPATAWLGGQVSLSLKPALPEGLEARWLTKCGDEDWDWNAGWVADSTYVLRPQKAGVWALQVDVRRKGAAQLLLQKWLGQVVVRDVPVLHFPAMPATMRLGEALTLAVEPTLPEGLEVRWLTMYSGEEWDWSAPWRKEPAYTFAPIRPGVCALSVEIRARGEGPPLLARSLGQVRILATLVDSLAYVPALASIPVGTELSFVVRPKAPLESLEFRLLETTAKNRVVQDWKPWPLEPFTARTPGLVGLQVNVRLKASPFVEDHRWLGEFFATTEQEGSGKSNLLRNLRADDFGYLDQRRARRVLARELWLAAHLLLWEAQAVPAESQVERLNGFAWVNYAALSDVRHAEVRLDDDQGYELDLRDRLFHQIGSAVQINLSLASYPLYRKVFELMGGSSDEVKAAAAVTYAVSEGYRYGTPLLYQNAPLAVPALDCGSLAVLLRDCLRDNGIAVQLVGVDKVDSDATHMVVLAQWPGGPVLLLDPTAGLVYELDARQGIKSEIPAPLALPTGRDLPFLDLRQFCSKACTAYVYAEILPGVIPVSPAHEPRGIMLTTGAPAPRTPPRRGAGEEQPAKPPDGQSP